MIDLLFGKKLNGVDANPFVVDKKQYGEDFKYTNNLYNLFIKRLSYALNFIHDKISQKKIGKVNWSLA